ncbi:MAG TPA: dipeptidase [Bacillota bacterium]|nr:dipeptidase [Bacillota bacterium]
MGFRKFRMEDMNLKDALADAHCDTITAMLKQNRRLCEDKGTGHLDLPRMQAGGIKLQFFAAFIAPEYKRTAVKRVLELIDLFYREIEENKKNIIAAKNITDIKKAVFSKKIAALLAVEGGEALGGSIGILRCLHRLGVRCLALTWNGRNELGDGVGVRNGEGLTPFGKSVVREMNRIKMIIDVSHLAEKGFWDVIELSGHPVIASHSNCKAVFRHPRNLNDDQIRAVAERGGVIGITYVPDFLGGRSASVREVLDHIEHAVNVGGIDCVGLGSDFDGTETLPEGLEDCSRVGAVLAGLEERGYSEEEIKKIACGNILRLIGQVLG